MKEDKTDLNNRIEGTKTDIIDCINKSEADLIHHINKSKTEIIIWIISAGVLQSLFTILSEKIL
jgi:hypothetical protein